MIGKVIPYEKIAHDSDSGIGIGHAERMAAGIRIIERRRWVRGQFDA